MSRFIDKEMNGIALDDRSEIFFAYFVISSFVDLQKSLKHNRCLRQKPFADHTVTVTFQLSYRIFGYTDSPFSYFARGEEKRWFSEVR